MQAVDMWKVRLGGTASPVDNATALPTAEPSSHMPTASHHERNR